MARASALSLPGRREHNRKGELQVRSEEREQRDAKRNRAVGEWMEALEFGRGLEGLADGRLIDIRFRMPTDESPEVLLVVRAGVADKRYVAFIGGLDITQVILAWRKRDRGRGLRWREDTPWEGSAGGGAVSGE